jgi:hypothetical protein
MTYPSIQQPAWQPPVVRPPLEPRQKKGAAIAGAVGFVLLSLGFALFALPLVLFAFAAFFTAIFGFIARVGGGGDRGVEQFMEGIQELHPEAWVVPLIIVAVVGLAIMAGALFLSAGILKSHSVNRAWPVTWAGAGVAIVGSWVVSGVLSVIVQLFSVGFGGLGQNENWAGAIAIGVISFVINLAASAVIGWLAWWWMAHLMRPAAAADKI